MARAIDRSQLSGMRVNWYQRCFVPELQATGWAVSRHLKQGVYDGASSAACTQLASLCMLHYKAYCHRGSLGSPRRSALMTRYRMGLIVSGSTWTCSEAITK